MWYNMNMKNNKVVSKNFKFKKTFNMSLYQQRYRLIKKMERITKYQTPLFRKDAIHFLPFAKNLSGLSWEALEKTAEIAFKGLQVLGAETPEAALQYQFERVVAEAVERASKKLEFWNLGKGVTKKAEKFAAEIQAWGSSGSVVDQSPIEDEDAMEEFEEVSKGGLAAMLRKIENRNNMIKKGIGIAYDKFLVGKGDKSVKGKKLTWDKLRATAELEEITDILLWGENRYTYEHISDGKLVQFAIDVVTEWIENYGAGAGRPRNMYQGEMQNVVLRYMENIGKGVK